jgi:hypothetical protein
MLVSGVSGASDETVGDCRATAHGQSGVAHLACRSRHSVVSSPANPQFSGSTSSMTT